MDCRSRSDSSKGGEFLSKGSESFRCKRQVLETSLKVFIKFFML